MFIIENKKHEPIVNLKNKILLGAYFIIKNFPMHASDIILDTYIKQQYNKSLKNLCIELLLSLTFHENKAGDLVLLFRDRRHDTLASLITYGNGAIPGSTMLKTALSK
jgi:hypothetical protein